MAETAAADIAHAEQLAEQALATLPRSTIAHFARAQVIARAAPIPRGYS
jgi:hypothetical protein